MTSHAGLGSDCGACHPAPWDARTMADACLACHTGVRAEVRAGKGLHGALSRAGGSPACDGCHPDHRGPDAALTVLDPDGFRHDVTGFSLRSHEKTASGDRFVCADCHPKDIMTFDQAVCVRCHRDLDAAFMTRHEATYGEDCLPCHDGTGRDGADFDHSAVPFKLTGKHADVPCGDCHTPDALATGHREHAAGLLRLPRRGRRARRGLRQALRGLPLGGCLGRGHVRPRGVPARPRQRGAQAHLRDLPSGRHGELHLLRVPRAHRGQRARRARGSRASPSWPTASAVTPADARPRGTDQLAWPE